MLFLDSLISISISCNQKYGNQDAYCYKYNEPKSHCFSPFSIPSNFFSNCDETIASEKKNKTTTGLHSMTLSSLVRAGSGGLRYQSNKGNTKTRTATSPQNVLSTSKLEDRFVQSGKDRSVQLGLHFTEAHYKHIGLKAPCTLDDSLQISSHRMLPCHGKASVPYVRGYLPLMRMSSNNLAPRQLISGLRASLLILLHQGAVEVSQKPSSSPPCERWDNASLSAIGLPHLGRAT